MNSIALNTMAQDSLRCANFDLNQNISEATLRVRVWNGLIKSFVSDIDRFESEFHLKNILELQNVVKVDLALALKHFRIPVFVAELGKESPIEGHEHKDFVKLGTVLSQSCLKLAEGLKSRGQEPLKARTFGTLIGYTSFKFVVASPEIFFNEKYGREELFVNLSFYDH